MGDILRITGGVTVEEHRLSGTSTTIGRAPDNDLRLDHPTVSLHHARVDAGPTGATVLDLGSSNGTFVDGRELAPREPHPLADADEVGIGPFTLTLRRSAEARAARPPAQPTVVAARPDPPRLVVTTATSTDESPLTGELVTLGRDPANDIVVDAEAVSRRHARLERRDGSYEIVDLGSTNGLRLEGRRVERRRLEDGDVLYIGRAVFLEYRAGAAFPPPTALEQPRRAVELPEGGALVVGRDPASDLGVADPRVSRSHARLERHAGRIVVEDLGSATGTFVNGRRVDRRELAEGDVVRVGSERLQLLAGRLEVADERGALELEASHLTVVVGKGEAGRRILDDVSLRIRPREFVAIVGASGSGKSTLVNALSGFRPATEGSVLVNGVDLYRHFDAYRTELGYVPQDDIIHRDLPVERALDYAARLRLPPDTQSEERQARVKQVLRELDLTGCADLPIKQLSGGQRKRVSIGVELLTRPSLFFLDEATSGLDPATETQLMKLLRRLADQGHTVALITHATRNVMLCDTVVVLGRGGRLAYVGPPDAALGHFDVREFDEIYGRLEERPSRAVPQTGRAPERAGGAGAADSRPARRRRTLPGSAAPPPKGRRVSSLRQFWILSRRYLDIVMRDRKTALLLLLLAPILGALDFTIWDRHLFDPKTGNATTALTMLFIATLITILVGTVTSVREIVKEDAIYRRERMVGVRVLPYVASKVAVGSLFALYSAIVLYVFLLASVDFSHLSAADLLRFLVPFLLGTFSGLAWGLLISAVAPTEDRAMLLVILVLVPQFVFSGGMVPVRDLGTAGKVIGTVTSTRWELGALATSARIQSGPCRQPDMSDCRMPGMEGLKTTGERQALVRSLNAQYGDIFRVNVYLYWCMCLLLAAVLLAAVLALQKRKDRVLT